MFDFENQMNAAYGMFYIVFIVIIVMFIFVIGSNILRWHKNNISPRLSVKAKVVGRRQEFYHRHHADHTSYHDTDHFVTFEVESGDRLEFQVDGREYGMLIEGDVGMLEFQGTRYLNFQRQ